MANENETPENTNEEISEEQVAPVDDAPEEVDEAVEEIETTEAQTSDEEEMEPIAEPVTKQSGKFKRFITEHKKAVSIVGGIFAVLLLAIVLVPPVRNTTLGLFMKTKVQIEVYDELVIDGETSARSQLNGLTVKVDGEEVATDAESIVELAVKPGKHTIEVMKENYDTVSQQITANLSLGSQNNPVSFKLEPNGRPLKVTVVNAITKEVLSDAKVSFEQATAQTSETGEATLILPIESTKKYELVVEKDGYSGKKIEVEVPNTPSKDATELGIVPEGKVYFLSKAEGTIDVVKTNLDGTEKEVVLEGTGRENDRSTVMVATRDWKYLALLSARDGRDKLWLINTETNEVSAVEDGADLSFTLYGWNEDRLVYAVTNQGIKYYENGKDKLKSYNASTNEYTLLEQTVRANTVDNPESHWTFNSVVLLNDTVAYIYSRYTYNQTIFKINYVNPDGSNKKTIFETRNINSSLYQLTGEPEELYFTVETFKDDRNISTYYEADLAGNVEKIEKEAYYPYLLSPSGDKVVWNERRDGKNTLIVGDTKLENGEEIYVKSEYSLYGWYNDEYLLVSKDNSELFITDATKAGTPLKISDYHKVEYPINSYGGGYGGGL